MLRSDLQSLRQGPGLNEVKVRRAATLIDLPIFHHLGEPVGRASAIHDLLVLWTEQYDHADRREALRAAFRIDVPDDAPVGFDDKLDVRRKHLSRARYTTQQAIRDREDAAIEDLIQVLVEACVDMAEQLRVERESLGGGLLRLSDVGGSPHTIYEAGISSVSLDFYRGVDWEKLLATSDELDIFFTYGRSWRRSLTEPLARFLDRAAAKTRVVLPEIEAPNVTALPEIAKRAGQTVDDLTDNVIEACKFFTERGASVWMSDTAELYASYRFTDVTIVTLYNHQRGQSEGIPTLTLHSSGTWYEWFQRDFVDLISNPDLSRRVT